MTDDVTEPEVPELAQITLDTLREHGWAHGKAHGPMGEMCLGTALMWLPQRSKLKLQLAIVKKLGLATPGSHPWIVSWQDAPERTWDDVEGLLISLGAQ